MRRWSVLLLAGAALAGAVGTPARLRAQPVPRYALTVVDLPLADALRRAAQLSRIALSYDPALAAGLRATCTIHDATLDALFACVLRSSPLGLFRVDERTYTLRRVPPPTNARTTAPPRTATLVGVVVDAQTGRGIEDVVASMGAFQTVVRGAGQLVFDGVPAGTYTLRLSHVGYAVREIPLRLLPGEKKTLRLALHARPSELAAVVVDGLSTIRRYERLGAEEPGMDVPAADAEAAAWPASPASALVDYRIQGAAEGDFLLTLDGTPAFPVPSLLGTLGPFGTLAIGRVSAQKAAFSTAMGASVAGVVDASHYLRAEPEATLLVDPFGVEARLSGTLDALPRTRSMLAVRTALPFLSHDDVLARSLAARVRPDPLLHALLGAAPLAPPGTWGAPVTDVDQLDVNATTQRQGRGVNSLATSVQFASRGLATRYPAATGAADTDDQRWRSYTAQASALTAIGGSTLARFRASASGYGFEHRFGVADTAGLRTFEQANHVTELGVDGRIDVALGDGVRGEFGAAALYASSYLRALALDGTPYASHHRQPRVAAFADLRLSPFPRVEAELGVRATFLPETGRSFGDPHLTLRIDGPTSPIGPWAARVAGGLYHQFVLSTLVPVFSPASPLGTRRTWTVPDTTVVTPAAEHYAAELRLDPTPWLGLQVDAFYRQQLRALAYAPPQHAGGEMPARAFLLNTALRTSGVGLGLDFVRPRFSAQLRYARQSERRRWPYGGASPGTPPQSQPQSGSVALAVRPLRGLELTARLRAATYDRWAYRLAYYATAQALADGVLAPDRVAALTPLVAALGPEAAEAPLPTTLRLDLGLAVQHTVGPVHAIGRLDLYNALDRPNPDEQDAAFDPSGALVALPRGGLPITLAASLRLTWPPPSSRSQER